jgi:hypothetical protein
MARIAATCALIWPAVNGAAAVAVTSTRVSSTCATGYARRSHEARWSKSVSAGTCVTPFWV